MVGATSVAVDYYEGGAGVAGRQLEGTPLRSPSPCPNLDTMSSDGSAGLGDVSDHPICITDVSNPDQVLSEDDMPPEVRVLDFPPEARINDMLSEVRINDMPPEVRAVDLPPEVRVIDLPPEVRIIDLPPGVCAADLTPEDCVVDLPLEGRVDAVSTATPPGSA